MRCVLARLPPLALVALSAAATAQPPTLAPTTGRVSGIALDVRNEPIPAALVEVYDAAWRSVLATTRTDASGVFFCRGLPFGQVMVFVTTPTLCGTRDVWLGPRWPSLDGQLCTLYEGEAMHGRVTGPDGRPVAGAEVIVARDFDLLAATTTDPDGQYRFARVPFGDSTVRVSAPGYCLAEVPARVREATALDVSLDAGGAALRVSIDVDRDRLETTIPTLQVRLQKWSLHSNQCLPLRLRRHQVGPDGVCVIHGLASGEYRVELWSTALHASTQSSELSLAAGSTTELLLKAPGDGIGPAVVLRGLAVDPAGEPMPGLALRIDGVEVIADDAGKFTAPEPVAAGCAPSVELATGTQRLAVPERVQPDGTLRLHIEPAVAVRGRVLTADRRPAAGAQVNLVDADGHWLAGLVDADLHGGFAFSGVAPREEPAWVEVSAFLGGGPRYGGGRLLLPVLPAGRALDDLEVVLDPAGALAGTIAAGGRPLAGVSVEAIETSDHGGLLTGSTDREGRFRIVGLPPGDYSVRARTTDQAGAQIGAWGPFTVAGGATTDLGELQPH